ncbi:Mucin-20, partial [Galemys pyrenaicus]
PRTNQPSPLVTTNYREVLAVTPGVGTSSERAFQNTDLTEISSPRLTPLETQTLSTQTSARNLILAGTFSEAETRGPKTIFPATEAKALTKITPSEFKIVIPTSLTTSVTSGTGTAMTTAETVSGGHLSEDVFDILCTDDSSEQAMRITADVLTFAHTSAETEALAWRPSPDNSVPVTVTPTSQALAPDTTPAKALIAYTITDTEAINCSIIKIETTVISETSDIDDSPEDPKETEKTPSAPETLAPTDSTEAKSYLTRTTASAKHSSTASATESALSDTTVRALLTASSTTERETTAAKAVTLRGTLVTGSVNLKETPGPSVKTRHSKVSISTEARSDSTEESSATVYSPSKVATIKNSTPSQTSAADSTTAGFFSSRGSPVSYVHETTIKGSQETNTLAKTRGSGGTSKTAITTVGKTPASLPTTACMECTTDVTAGDDGGVLLLRLSVVSPEDLTDPPVAERLMQ